MPNDLDAIIPKIVSRGLLSLREKAILPRLVNSDFSAEVARKGDMVDIPISHAVSVEDVVPSHISPQPPDSSVSSVSVRLDNWKKASFFLTDKEVSQIDSTAQFVPLQMQEAINALAAAVNQSVLDLHTQITNKIGFGGATPFQPEPDEGALEYHGVRPATGARRVLNENKAPKSGRFGVINYDAEANALALPQFSDLSRTGSSDVILEGQLGRKFGIDWFASDNMPIQDFGTETVRLAHTAPAGDGDFRIPAALTQFEVGRFFTIVGSDRIHRVDEFIPNVAANTHRIFVTPTIENPNSSSTHVTFVPKVVSNLVMQRDAVALVMRPLAHTALETGSHGQMMSITDPETGLSLRLEVSRQYKQTVWEFDILWGVKMVRPEWAVKILG